MHKAGRFAVIAGIALVLIGMVIGFTALFLDKDSDAIIWLATVPVGFVVLLTGIVTTQFSQRSDEDK